MRLSFQKQEEGVLSPVCLFLREANFAAAGS